MTEKQKELQKQLYINSLQKDIDFADGLKALDENKTFKELVLWMEKELERTKNQMLKCKKEEIFEAREYARGFATILKQLKIFKKSGERAEKKLKELIKREKSNQPK